MNQHNSWKNFQRVSRIVEKMQEEIKHLKAQLNGLSEVSTENKELRGQVKDLQGKFKDLMDLINKHIKHD